MNTAAVVLLAALGLGWRALVSARTPLPSEDGVTYLWMAERFAAGDAAAALGEVFPPLTSLVVALPVALGVDPFRAAQGVLAVAGALAVLPLARAAEHVVPGGGLAAAWLTAFAPLPVRCGAEAYSEPLYLLCAAVAVDAGVRGRAVGLGAAAALAFWVRPEAAVLLAAFVVASPRRAWRALLPFALGVGALALWRYAHGYGLDPLPKAAFNWERSIAASSDPQSALSALLANALEVPWLWVEAFGVLGLLALWGLLRGRVAARAPLALALAGGVLLVCCFLPRRRFLLSWLVAAAPFAVAGLRALPSAWQRPLLALAVVSSLVLSLRVTAPDRAAERAVGEFLAAEREPGEVVVGDLTRVIYYAGLRPLPPRHVSAQELVRAARQPAVRFVVLGARRPTAAVVRSGLAGAFAPRQLPAELAAAAAERGILVLERKPERR